MSKPAQRPTTAIAWAFPDRVIVRDEDLCSALIGHLSLTDYFHFLLLGRMPDAQQRILLDACFVALAEHGLVPSVQAARMTLAAAPEAWQGAVAAGLLGCGSVILGSSEIAGRLLAKIVSEAKATNVSLRETAALRVAALRQERTPLPGFGHPLHREEDPRATRLLKLADELGTAGDHVAAVRAVAQATTSVYGRPLVLNISGAIPAVLLDVGFPLPALKGVPLVGRTVSLIAHLLEESAHPIGFALAHAAEASIEFTGDRAPANSAESNA
jgi:citrate synthase